MKLTAIKKAEALVDAGIATDLAEAAEMLVDMGEISYGAANRIAERAA